jgi:hypothetical protein
MASITREARDGLMRVWLEILRERHPGVTWVTTTRESTPDDLPSEGVTLKVASQPVERAGETAAALAA